jgi:hypothetical protein
MNLKQYWRIPFRLLWIGVFFLMGYIGQTLLYSYGESTKLLFMILQFIVTFIVLLIFNMDILCDTIGRFFNKYYW